MVVQRDDDMSSFSYSFSRKPRTCLPKKVSPLNSLHNNNMKQDEVPQGMDVPKKDCYTYRSSTTNYSSNPSNDQPHSTFNTITNQRLQSSSQRASSLKSHLSELKSSISEMKNLSNTNSLEFGQRFKKSMEDILEKDKINEKTSIKNDYKNIKVNRLNNISEPYTKLSQKYLNGRENDLIYSAARTTSASSSSLITDGFSASKSAANSSRSRQMQHGDVLYSDQSAVGATKRLLQAESLTAEQNSAYQQERRTLQTAEINTQQMNNVSTSSSRLHTDAFSAERTGTATSQARQTVSSSGIYSRKEHASVAHSNMSLSSKNISTSSVLSSQIDDILNGTNKPNSCDLLSLNFEDLEELNCHSSQKDIEIAIENYKKRMCAFITAIKHEDMDTNTASLQYNKINEMLRRAWAVPTHGHELGNSLCNTLRTSGGLDVLMENCMESKNPERQFASAKILEQCLTTENREYVVKNGLGKVVNAVVSVCTKNANLVEYSRVGTGILQHLFKHSEATCSDVIKLGGLDAVLFECRKNDIETLRHCATALANLSLYGGAENQEAMIKKKVPMWLFPLAFHHDDNIKYYACLAIAVLVANKEIEAAVLKSGTLELVEPFVTSHNPSEFARSNLAHAHGQSKAWLQKLVPVLSSKREEARNLAAFHFCMEAGIKKQQCKTEIFREIGAIEPLKKVASCPNAIASKFAAQTLRFIGEEVPHKLSQQVPLWSIEDVKEWVKQIGFIEYANEFYESKVDGDLLLQITEENLRDDIGLTNGIKRKRFARELQQLKKMADYSLRDTCSLHEFLQSIGPEYTIYTYSMLNAGVDKKSIFGLSDEQLENECYIKNSIHRLRILNAIRDYESRLPSLEEDNMVKNLDVFISYRRSNGSQLASLLKVHLNLRGFTIFIDVERLEAGKFENLLQSIRQAKHFLLVLTPNALDKCMHDSEQKDWLHREIVAALQSQCNIVPIIDNFEFPEPEELPEDMRAVCHFNAVRWIHDYQDACVEKLESFLRGKSNLATRLEGSLRGPVSIQSPCAVLNRGPPNFQQNMQLTESDPFDK
ncbi:NAD(+) hydrolase sarm1 isoform X2 [Pieris rapae]|uniref:NAD(+) hydrolase sarm1 isoform X2 n=1 Tax=Pieris rapae TaxID=64459 RepID=UPI001E27E61A|nr:NAD(+) hydrolase sarm1 isoform X2 [Pieris rapae]